MDLDDDLVDRLYKLASAERWSLSHRQLSDALEASASRAFAAGEASRSAIERYLESLHLADLALACACAAGHGAAWDHFVTEYRPVLYRAAEAIDRSGVARELADSLYADLYGLDGGTSRRSLFRYYHGRSALATWLRAVLAQRRVDQVRRDRRFEPLAEDASAPLPAPPADEPGSPRWRALFEDAFTEAVARLNARERLRLSCYYMHGMTLAQIGRLLKEHEATVSRQLARTRRTIREDVEQQLQTAGLGQSEMSACFESMAEDPGMLSLSKAIGSIDARTETPIVLGKKGTLTEETREDQ